MKTLLSILALLFVINPPSFSQNLSQEESLLSESILIQKSYHIDLPTYAKAKLIVDRLVAETSLTELEIKEVLDEMVSSHKSVTRQMLEKFHGLPTFTDTGNPEQDKENYKFAKNEWVDNNPELYQELINSNKTQK